MGNNDHNYMLSLLVVVVVMKKVTKPQKRKWVN